MYKDVDISNIQNTLLTLPIKVVIYTYLLFACHNSDGNFILSVMALLLICKMKEKETN